VAAEGMMLVSGGEPEAVLCGPCNTRTTADAQAWADSLRKDGPR
jgi:hypothetical protein